MAGWEWKKVFKSSKTGRSARVDHRGGKGRYRVTLFKKGGSWSDRFFFEEKWEALDYAKGWVRGEFAAKKRTKKNPAGIPVWVWILGGAALLWWVTKAKAAVASPTPPEALPAYSQSQVTVNTPEGAITATEQAVEGDEFGRYIRV